MSGICGNLNCDETDDWTLSDGTECTTLDATVVSIEDAWIRDTCEFDCANSFILNPNEIETDIGENIAGPTCDPAKYNQESLFNSQKNDAKMLPKSTLKNLPRRITYKYVSLSSV